MQEFFFTILAIWVIWKLFNAFNSSRVRETSQQFNQTNHYHFKKDGDVKIEPKRSNNADKDEEYTDYEEIK